MNKRIWIDGFILIVVFAFGWFLLGYFQKPVRLPESMLSKDKEAEIGAWLEKQIIAEYGLYENHPWEQNIQEILARIDSSTMLKNKDYNVVVLKTKEVNAFATFGNTVYFFSGLMEKIESNEQFAGILAHEIGHIEKNHVWDKLMTEFGLTVILSIVSGGDPALTLQLTKEVISGSFSRKKEEEADLFALNVLHNSNIHPMHLGLIFKKIKKLHDEKFEIPFEIMHSHPDIDSRIRKAFEFAKPDFKEVAFKTAWPLENKQHENKSI